MSPFQQFTDVIVPAGRDRRGAGISVEKTRKRISDDAC
jgi:hypothetical protein